MKRFFPWVLLVFTTAVLVGASPAQQVTSNTTKTETTAPANPANDPLFDVPPMPQGKVSLVGGTVAKIDRVRNRMAVRPFGGGSMDMYFDERTHIFRDGVETTQLGVRKGDRVYVDTMLDGSKVFARNIRVATTTTPADARGQILYYDANSGMMRLRDELSSQEVTFQVGSSTAIRNAGATGSRSDLKPGSLVAVRFSPEGPDRGAAQESSIIAVPGTTFVFAGTISDLDLHLGTFAIQNRTDQKTYELRFNPANVAAKDKLTVGAEVTASAVFDGSSYVANNITVNQTKAEK